jgi:phage-related protein
VADPGSRRFLIQFIVDAEDAVQNSARLSGALAGVGTQMGQASAQIQAAQPAVTGMTKGLQGATTTIQQTQTSTTQFSKGLGKVNKAGMSTTRRLFEMIRLGTGLGAVFRGLARGSPLQVIMGLGMAMLRIERLFGRGKKQMQGVVQAQQKMTKTSKVSRFGLIGMALGAVRWAKGLKMVRALSLKNLPAMKAFSLGMSKQTTAGKQFAGMLGGRVRGAGSVKAADAMKASLTRFNKAGKIAGKGVGVLGKGVGKAGKLMKFFTPALGTFLKFILPLGLALGAIVVVAMILKDVLKPIIGIFKMVFKVFGSLISVIALPLVMMFEQLFMVVAELLEPVMQLTEALMPVAMIFGQVLMEPIKLLGKLLIPFVHQLFEMMGGMEGLVPILEQVGVFLAELANVMTEVIVVVFDSLREMMPEIVMGMKGFFKLLGFVIKVLALFFLGVVKLWTGWLKFTMPIRKFIFGIILKGFALVGQFLDWLIEKFVSLVESIHPVVSAIWDGIVGGFNAIVDAAKSVWKWLFGSGLFGIPEAANLAMIPLKAIGVIIDGIASIAGGVKDAVSAAFTGMVSVASSAWEGIKSVWSGAKGFFSGVWGWITGDEAKAGASGVKKLSVTQQVARDNMKGLVELKKAGEEYRSAQQSATNATGLPLTVTQQAMRDNMRGLGELKKAGEEYRASVAAKQAAGISLTPMERMAAHRSSISDSSVGGRAYQSVQTAPAQNAEPGARSTPHTSSQAAAGGSTPIKITVPVTVQLDGFVLARAVSEYLIDIKRERYQNDPLSPMRGVEPGLA